ncbi:MAG: hypothetical protein WC700_18040 [Gemmatimonadaceae bacterium]|jgi:hypothetical protein
MIYAREYDLSVVDKYPTEPSCVWPEEIGSFPSHWVVTNSSTGKFADHTIIAVSFDGVTDHVQLQHGQQSQRLELPTRARSLWLRQNMDDGVFETWAKVEAYSAI